MPVLKNGIYHPLQKILAGHFPRPGKLFVRATNNIKKKSPVRNFTGDFIIQ